MNPGRIGAIGAGGTGKTTLMRHIAEQLNIPYRPSVNRAVFEKFGFTQLTHTELTQADRLQIQRASFYAKIEQDAEFTDGVFERSLLDHYMYCLLYCYEAIPADVINSMEAMVADNLTGYRYLLFFPIYPWGTEPTDGFRDASLANRKLQEYILLGFIKTHPEIFNEVHWKIVPDIGIEERKHWWQNLFI
jgi:nicotinamide riboside kinase